MTPRKKSARENRTSMHWTQGKRCRKCQDPLQNRNTSGYCRAHAFLARKKFSSDHKTCIRCGSPIKPWNERGYCVRHAYMADRKKEWPVPARHCAHCGKILATFNRSGYCAKHHDPSQRRTPQFCSEPSCTNKKPLRSDSKTGFCIAHRHLVRIPKRGFCKDCNKKLGGNNQIGYCKACRPKHFAEQDRLAAASRTAARLKLLREKAAAHDAQSLSQEEKIGSRVEELIPKARKQDKRAIVTARDIVSGETQMAYSTIAKYHKAYRVYHPA